MMAKLGAAFAAAALLAGCQSGPPHSADSGAPLINPSSSLQRSGFLKNETYAKLAPVPGREGVLTYVDRSVNYTPYKKILFEPTAIFVVPNPDYKGLPREALARMTANFQNSFMAALSPDYVIVTTPGPDVLRVRSAITGVQPASPDLGVTDYIPIKALYNVARKTAGAAPQVAEMSAEMEVTAPDGSVVLAGAASRKGEAHLAQGEQITWTEMQAISDYWARNFKQRLDELRGASAGQ